MILSTKIETAKNWGAQRLFDSSASRARFVSALVGILVILIWSFRIPPLASFLAETETVFQDAMVRVRAVAGTVASPRTAKDVVLVTVDDESVRALGAYPPLPRQVYAHLCRSLEDAGADVIGFNLIFDGPSRAFEKGKGVSPQLNNHIKELFGDPVVADATADDAALASAFAKKNNVVLAAQIDLSGKPGAAQVAVLAPKEQFISSIGGSSCLGNVAVQLDSDGILRRGTLSGGNLPAHWSINTPFAVRLAEKKFQSPAITNPEGIFIAGKFVPNTFRINFAGPAGTFESIPLWKAIEWRKFYNEESQAQNPFAHKIVLIGYQDLSADENVAGQGMPSNSLATPIAGWLFTMSNLEVQANIVSNIISSQFIKETNRWQDALILTALTAVFALFAGLSRGRNVALIATTIGLAATWFSLCVIAFFMSNLLLPCTVPIIGIFGTSFLLIWTDENFVRAQQRRRKTRLFRRLASRQVADEIDKHQLAELGLEGKEAEITVLVCEIDNLSDLLEGLEPKHALATANGYVELISKAVTTHGGVIERYLNHGVVAIWGAPLKSESRDQAERAVRTATDISSAMIKQNSGEQIPRCLIGISPGKAFCGMVGTEDNALYTAMGRPVDSAFQMMSDNRKFGTHCILSGSTAKLLGNTLVETRELSLGAECLHELLGNRGELPGALEEASSLYRRAMAALEEHNRTEAERLLESALRLLPDDGPSQAALANCRRESAEDF